MFGQGQTALEYPMKVSYALMACERIHVWIGNFKTSLAPDYFTETISEDDTAISPFVGGQGEVFVDHDWMEANWLDEAIEVEKLLSPHMYQADQRNRAVSIAHEMGIQRACLVVTIDEDEIAEPRSVEQPPLIYLGCFANVPPGPEEIEAAARAGDTKAQAAIGRMYVLPPPANSDMKDLKKAEYWLLKAAENGEARAYNGLYHVYSKASESNPEKAFYYLRKAVEQGSAADFNYLSEMYANGEGTPRDDVQAMVCKFLQLCSYDTDRYDTSLKALAAKMSAADIAEAERRALAWIEENSGVAPYFGGFVRNPLTDLSRESDPAQS